MIIIKSPQLYYSPESIRERQTHEVIKQSNSIAREKLEFEHERLCEEKFDYGTDPEN